MAKIPVRSGAVRGIFVDHPMDADAYKVVGRSPQFESSIAIIAWQDTATPAIDLFAGNLTILN